MSSTYCLMIMNAREIPECILPFKALTIDKVWFKGFTEKQLEQQIKDFISKTKYSHYILVSDDVIVTQQALNNLLKFIDKYPIVTGWCNIFAGEQSVALELSPYEPNTKLISYINILAHTPKTFLPIIRFFYHKTPIKYILDYILYKHFPSMDEIWNMPEVFQTYFINWALTSMTREIWEKYPFYYPTSDRARHGSDADISKRFNLVGIPMMCARDSFVYHLGSKRNFIVGQVKPEVIYEPLDQTSTYSQDYISTPNT